MSNKVKAAIIGLGWAGCEHLKGYVENPQSEVIAVCDMDEDRARQIAKEAADGCYCTHECGHYASTIYSFTKVGAVAIDAARTHLVKKMLTP